MAYATIEDIQARMTRDLSADEQAVGTALLDDAAVIIDMAAPDATAEAKMVVSCRMVIRAIPVEYGAPLGATQGSMSALGYSQSWTMGAGGGVGELYLGRLERRLLGLGDRIGSYSPTQELVPEVGT